MSCTYLMGHSANEALRLTQQAKLFSDPLLNELVSDAKKCLEIGCGIGSNYHYFKQINPALQYIGIDNSAAAIKLAQQYYGCPSAEFKVTDILDMPFCSDEFDLIISKLVLWTLGNDSKKCLEDCLRLLKPGGIFYAFEPYDKNVVLQPTKPVFTSIIKEWDRLAVSQGHDPFIGAKIPLQMAKTGFQNIHTKFFPIVALSTDAEKYDALRENLIHFYLGDGPNNPSHKLHPQQVKLAKKEMYAKDFGLIMDSFFVTWGSK